MLNDLLPKLAFRPRLIEQWKFDRGFRHLLGAFTESERLIRDLGNGADDSVRAQCDVYRIRNKIHSGISLLGETRLRTIPQPWRHVREGAKEADECLSYALESLEYGEIASACTDLERALDGLRESLFTIRTRSTLRYRSWPLDPWRWVARRVTAGPVKL